MADVPYLLKNLKSAFVRGHIITIPQDVVDMEHLLSNVVPVDLLQDSDVLPYEDGMAIKLAPNHFRCVLDHHFEKMKVSSAMLLIKCCLEVPWEEERHPNFTMVL